MKITVVQPRYFCGENPDEKIADFLITEMKKVSSGGIVVLPEYSNAGGLSEPDKELAAIARSKNMLKIAGKTAKEKSAYVAINVLEKRNGEIKNSTYLFDKNGNVAFVYDKHHLPVSEVRLGIKAGNSSGKCGCVCEVDGIKFAFMTCYDIYFNEQIEYIAKHKPDIILIPGYQRGERTDIIHAQAKLCAFRCNAFVARASYSMDSDEHGGCSMIVAPDGRILENIGKGVGSISVDVNPTEKYMRQAGFGEKLVRNDDFISDGLCPESFV